MVGQLCGDWGRSPRSPGPASHARSKVSSSSARNGVAVGPVAEAAAATTGHTGHGVVVVEAAEARNGVAVVGPVVVEAAAARNGVAVGPVMEAAAAMLSLPKDIVIEGHTGSTTRSAVVTGSSNLDLSPPGMRASRRNLCTPSICAAISAVSRLTMQISTVTLLSGASSASFGQTLYSFAQLLWSFHRIGSPATFRSTNWHFERPSDATKCTCNDGETATRARCDTIMLRAKGFCAKGFCVNLSQGVLCELEPRGFVECSGRCHDGSSESELPPIH